MAEALEQVTGKHGMPKLVLAEGLFSSFEVTAASGNFIIISDTAMCYSNRL